MRTPTAGGCGRRALTHRLPRTGADAYALLDDHAAERSSRLHTLSALFHPLATSVAGRAEVYAAVCGAWRGGLAFPSFLWRPVASSDCAGPPPAWDRRPSRHPLQGARALRREACDMHAGLMERGSWRSRDAPIADSQSLSRAGFVAGGIPGAASWSSPRDRRARRALSRSTRALCVANWTKASHPHPPVRDECA